MKRVLRVLEYVGTDEWVDKTIERSIAGVLEFPGIGKIIATTIDDTGLVVESHIPIKGRPHDDAEFMKYYRANRALAETPPAQEVAGSEQSESGPPLERY